MPTLPESKPDDLGVLEKSDVDHGISQVIVPDDRQRYLRNIFDRRVLPLVCMLYVLSYLDRGNIGNAKTAGAQADLGLSSKQWTWVLNAFYITYEIFEWTTMLWKILPAHIFVSVLCVGWGTAAICSGVVSNLAGLAACRAILGICEVMLATGSPFYLSMFYQRHELGLRMAFLLGSSPLANCFASAVAYGITHINSSWADWRWLFVIEGIPTIIIAPFIFFFLPDSPSHARFLTEEEKTLAVERIQMRDTTAKSEVHWHQYLAGLADYKTYVHALIQFAWNYSFASLSNFLPTIINEMGFTSVDAQGLTAPPYFAACLCCVVGALVSDRWGKRGPLIAFFGALSFLGYLMLLVTTKTSVRYAGVFFACCGTFPIVALNLTWVLNNLGSDSKKGASLAVVATVGQLTSFLGSAVFPNSAGPKYTLGCALGCGFCALIVVAALALHFVLARENKKRDRENGPVFADEFLDLSNLGDKHPKFRYFT
ncbi:hypothetical protein BP5796_00216 [Coleophoma crateriformis]|uniref:Major facilitator superfamily (MFS) profile domain-containing protein n=1 Tax=Coleophoma crateriformis TaxID=565419 RepID=A0A3D8T7B5_9HELO|nr:hypothetical protein BP5796_00216 [Coleophoma crateriformis]